MLFKPGGYMSTDTFLPNVYSPDRTTKRVSTHQLSPEHPEATSKNTTNGLSDLLINEIAICCWISYSEYYIFPTNINFKVKSTTDCPATHD